MVQQLFTPVSDPRPDLTLQEALIAALTNNGELPELERTEVQATKPAAVAVQKYQIRIGQIVKESADGKNFTIYHPETDSTGSSLFQTVPAPAVTETKKEQWSAAKNDPAFKAAYDELLCIAK